MKKLLLLSSLFLAFSMVLRAQSLVGDWSGDLQVGTNSLPLVFHFGLDSSGNATCSLDSPMQGAKGIPASVLYFSADSVSTDMPLLGASFRGKLVGGEIKGLFSQSGYSFELILKPGAKEMSRPQTPKLPFPYKTSEISFTNPNDGAVLSGTLTYPVDYASSKPSTVVLMVSGSGAQSRDEEIAGHKPFAVIADYFARHGIASLRFDDRGIGKSTGPTSNLTTQTTLSDARAALSYLRKSKQFHRIGLLGHSEGGLVAFLIAGQYPKETDFVISLAGNAIRGDSLLLEQNRIFLRQSGLPESTTEAYCRVLSRIFSYIIEANPAADRRKLLADYLQAENADLPPTLQENLLTIMESTDPWLPYFLQCDPAPMISRISCPVLALGGSLDTQVPASSNLGALRRLLPKHPQSLVREFPGLNHLFQHAKTGNVAEYGAIEETISEEVLAEMGKWIQNL